MLWVLLAVGNPFAIKVLIKTELVHTTPPFITNKTSLYQPVVVCSQSELYATVASYTAAVASYTYTYTAFQTAGDTCAIKVLTKTELVRNIPPRTIESDKPVSTCCVLLAAGDTFAIKVLTKTELVRKNMVESVTNERNILAMVSLTNL
jgi:hypothetical protein